MKQFFISVFILSTVIMVGCNRKDDKTGQAEKASKKISKRNYFISRENACNDFFFDSLQLVKYINDQQLPDSIARRMTSFYNSRNYQFGWFSSEGISEQVRGFWNMYKYYSNYDPAKVIKNPAFAKTMDSLMASTDSVWKGKQARLVNTELQVTEYYLRFFLSNISKGYLKRKEIEKFIASVKRDPIEMADSLVNKKHKDEKYYADVNGAYGDLQTYLAKYLAVYKNGGWPTINEKPALLKPGSHSAVVPVLKKRLFLSEDLSSMDSTAIWTDSLTDAIKKFQYRHGYKATGILTAAQLNDMNVPLVKRIEQILINMTRVQWIIDQPKGSFIYVNIPEFLLRVSENGTETFNMPVVVGMEGHNTMLFTGRLTQVVFAPYWNVPESIVEKEIVPAMEKDKHYLASHNMEINGKLSKGLPAIRQLPGEGNSLGLVKFLFPNSYDIYFHDTPAKSLFAKEKRAFSHGCIRLSQPKKMAEWLLRKDRKWNSESIDDAMHGKEEKTVSMEKSVPVMISYYTAWVADDGLLRFADDVYGHDKAEIEKVFVHHRTYVLSKK